MHDEVAHADEDRRRGAGEVDQRGDLDRRAREEQDVGRAEGDADDLACGVGPLGPVRVAVADQGLREAWKHTSMPALPTANPPRKAAVNGHSAQPRNTRPRPMSTRVVRSPSKMLLADPRCPDGEVAVERHADERAGGERDRVDAVVGDAELVRQEQGPPEDEGTGGVHPPGGVHRAPQVRELRVGTSACHQGSSPDGGDVEVSPLSTSRSATTPMLTTRPANRPARR